jgi:predicted Rossmann-fold nucleotide-binding protein
VLLYLVFAQASMLGASMNRLDSDTPLPFDPHRATLYTRDELTAGFDGQDISTTLDQRIQAYFDAWRRQRPRNLSEGLAQRTHDYFIETALENLINPVDAPSAKIVGIMGKHDTPREASIYREVARLSRLLSSPQRDYLVVTGGGPGIMEAGSLGAYLSPYPEEAIDDAIEMLDDHTGAAYINTANAVRNRYSTHGDCLAVPTWSYADEPISQFSSHIAKYFANSVREDGLLAIALYGVVFAPGGSGTLQEIFQDATQNTYWSFNWRSPMVLLGRTFFTEEFPAYQLLAARAKADGYDDMVTICDTAAEAVDFLEERGPRPKELPDPPPRTFGRSGPAFLRLGDARRNA